MTAITIIKDPSDTSKALMSWSLPSNNFETITALTVQILQKDGSYSSVPDCSPLQTDTSCSISIF